MGSWYALKKHSGAVLYLGGTSYTEWFNDYERACREADRRNRQ
jgi:hypothetical protein